MPIRTSLLLALTLPPATIAAQRPLSVPTTPMSNSSRLHDSRREAAAILQGTKPAGAKGATLDSALIEEVAAALQGIRGAVPELTNAITDANASALHIELRPAAGRRVRRRGTFLPERSVWGMWRLPIRKDGAMTGIRLVDSLSRRYGLVAAILWSIGPETQPDPGYELTLSFGHYVNIPELIQEFGHVAEAEAIFDADPPFGDTYVTTLIEPRDLAGTTWRFVFTEAHAECPGTCTAKTVVTYDRVSHQATLVSRDTAGIRH